MIRCKELAVGILDKGVADSEDQVRLKDRSVLLLDLTFQYHCEGGVVRHDANVPDTNLSLSERGDCVHTVAA